ncbi:major facilitator superfamily domain-containing protein [Talaromyces proteolyticus]|uniref:Major facilitator superfamily domain-containing protein n=1 Tax=Talaromyces proteolyticus TaxID=1131652 RepID=A0AAD4KVL2_9EURO|nr:major facilitator superfamily domain-containing protein [Talaromyces proteolyticus]KAH8697104.1 major facilitator superfamily domain-containing protein [Talaromyces proteolyticus]
MADNSKPAAYDAAETIEHVDATPSRQQHHHHHEEHASKDKAADVLEDAGHSAILTPENNARVLRLIDWRILPIVLGIYFLQALDKATLAYGSVFGLVTTAHLHGQQYSWLGAVVYLAQLVCQPIVAYTLVKVPLGKFLGVTVFCWGAVLSAMAAAKSFPSLLVCRMLLGAFEAGVAPAFISLTQMWYRRREQPVRLGAWYAMNGITNMFGSLLSWGLGHISSATLAPYQIIFLFFGLLTVVFSAVVLIFMPDSPIDAKFLKGEDKLVAVERLRLNQQGIKNDVWKWDHVKEAVFDPKTWLWFAMLFSISVPSGGISTFGPLIIKGFGYDQFTTILFNMPFGAVQLIATMGGAYVAMVWKLKSPVLMFLSIPPIIGCVMLLVLPHDASHRGPLLVGYYLISVYPGITPLIYSWQAANTAGETKKKITTAIMIVGQSAGNVLGPNLYTTDEAPLYRRGLISNLVLFIVLIILYAIQILILKIQNHKHEKTRESLGKTAKVVDKSMLAVKTPSDEDLEVKTTANVLDRSLQDITDWQNEDFVYVY